MDIIFLHDLTIETIIGIYDWERKEKQSVVLDLDMGANIAELNRDLQSFGQQFQRFSAVAFHERDNAQFA